MGQGDINDETSPASNLYNKVSQDDQMRRILSIIGFPKESDKSFIYDIESQEYIDQLYHPGMVKSKIEIIFAQFDSNLVELLKGLLEFNPHFRLTAQEAL